MSVCEIKKSSLEKIDNRGNRIMIGQDEVELVGAYGLVLWEAYQQLLSRELAREFVKRERKKLKELVSTRGET